MDVRHCPKCGSENIDKSSSSFEYGGSTRWDCNSCEWRYKKGRGIGTGTGNSGAHPRDVGEDRGQMQLTETGSWCSNCEVCAKAGRCGCVDDDQTGFCDECATFSEHDVDKMLDVNTYSGRYNSRETFTCDICNDQKARLKLL